MLDGGTGSGFQLRNRSSFSPWKRPQSTIRRSPPASSRYLEPVTVPVAPRKVSVAKFCPLRIELECRPGSNHHRLLILAEDAAESVGDFTHGGVSLDGVENGGQQIVVGARGLFHGLEGRLHTRGVAAGAQARQAVHLGTLDFGIDAQQWRCGAPLIDVLVNTHHDAITPLNGLLIFVSRLLNLALRIARFDGLEPADNVIRLCRV